MPYDVFQVDNQHCVYKVDDEGQRSGERLGCHATPAEAHRQIAAIERQERSEMSGAPLYEQVSAFGDYAPTVPFAEGINIEGIKERDPDPMFVTLPIMKVNSESRNGRRYPRSVVQSIVDQINQRIATDGLQGHMKAEDRGTRFDYPVIEWVGATLDANGMAYAKGYIPQYAQSTREYIANAKDLRKRVATSIYGWTDVETGTVSEVQLEKIDLADPARAGVPEAIAHPIITSEMSEENGMTDNTNQTLIAELRQDRDAARERIAEMQTELNDARQRLTVVSELEQLLGTADLKAAVSEMQTQLETAQTERDQLQRTSLGYIARDVIAEQVEYDAARPIVAEMLGVNWDAPEQSTLEADGRDMIEERVKQTLERKPVQEMIKAMVFSASGGRAIVGEQAGGHELDVSPEAREKARRLYGI